MLNNIFFQNLCTIGKISLPNKTENTTYVLNLGEYSDIGTHWIAFYAIDNNVTYFDSFGAEHTKLSKEIKKFLANRNIITNIYRKQAFHSIICGYFGIGFIDLILKGKSLLQNTNFFPPSNYERNDKIIPK